MKNTKKIVALLTALLMLLSLNCCFAEEALEEAVETVTLQGVGETLGMDGETMQPTAAALALDLANGKATLELTTETMGMNFYLLASEMSEDPTMAMLYMMCSIIGEGKIAEAEEGYLVTFAWEMESMDESNGATVKTPMTLEIPVKVEDTTYTATIDYLGIVVEISSEIAEN